MMQSDEVVAMIAAELRQQQDLQRVFTLRRGQHAQIGSAEECESAIAHAYYSGRALPVCVADGAALPRLCLAVYQNCLLESATQGEPFELARGRLRLMSSWEKETAWVEFMNSPPRRDEPELSDWCTLALEPRCRRTIGTLRADDPVFWETVCELILEHGVAEAAAAYDERAPAEFEALSFDLAGRAVEGIGRATLAALATQVPVEGGVLGRLHWNGAKLDYRPSRAILDRVEIASMRAARAKGRSYLIR